MTHLSLFNWEKKVNLFYFIHLIKKYWFSSHNFPSLTSTFFVFFFFSTLFKGLKF